MVNNIAELESINTNANISARAVKRIFHDTAGNEVIALQKVDLEIKNGEFISLIGPSGCGKTTLLRIIAGLDTPTDGQVFINDNLISGPDYQRGFVFQDPTLFPWLNVYDNVSSGLKARKVFKQEKYKVNEYIKLVGLAGFEKAYPHQLSGGMAQRASLARALVNNPKVLLMDEPLGALDAFTRMQMQDEILRIWKEKRTTMVLVTHDVDEAIYLCDRIVVMTSRPGKIQAFIDVNLSRPRARNHPDFLFLRTKILETLNFAKELPSITDVTI